MIITKIEEMKYSYKIYVNEEYVGILRKKTLKEHSFFENQKIENEDEFRTIILEDEYESAKNKVLRLLGFASKTEKEIVQKLQNENFQRETIERVVAFLKDYKFINDEYYAKIYTESAKNTGKSKRAIKNTLMRKGFDKEVVFGSLESISEEDEFKNAINIGKKKLKLIKEEDGYERAKKLKQYLAYKGFNYNIADKVVRYLLNDFLE